MPKGNQFWSHSVSSVFTDSTGYTGLLGADRAEVAPSVVGAYSDANSVASEGERYWKFVFNDEATTAWAAGTVVMRDTAANEWDGLVSTGTVPRNVILGVSQHAVAAGSVAWIGRSGFFEVLSNGSVTARASIMSAASGQATDMTGTNEDDVIGAAFESQSTTGSLMLIWAKV